MGVLKLSVIEEQLKEQRAKLKLQKKNKEKHIGNCSCWAFLHKGEVVDSHVNPSSLFQFYMT